VKDGEHQPRNSVSTPIREPKTCNHVPQPSVSVPLDHNIVHTFRAGVEVGYLPTRVDVGTLLVHVIRPNIGWVDADELTDPIPPTSGIHRSIHRVYIIVASPQGRWKLWVSGCHRSTSADSVAESMIGSPLVTSLASGRKPAHSMNGVYRSSHMRVLCMRILNGCSTYM
jgi:hypothetical protein